MAMIVMAAVQDGRDELIKTAVEKTQFTVYQTLRAHSSSVYLGDKYMPLREH